MRWRWVLLWTVYLLAGCNRGPSNVLPVQGSVLFNGLPARAGIVAQAVDEQGKATGRPSTADTRADGTYSLAYAENQPGALIGKHRVTVSVYPLERAVDELSFQQRFQATKVVRFTRQVDSSKNNRWNFVLTY